VHVTATRTGLVFVHGFHSSAQTWAAFAQLVESDTDLGEFVVRPFEYASPLAVLNPLKRIPDFDDVADNLATFLRHDLNGFDRVALVSHSQGGLVVQRFLARTLAAAHGQDLARVRLVVMFACPNSGSELLLFLRKRAWFWRNPQERDLRPVNKAITEAQRIVLHRVVNATGVSATECRIPFMVYAGDQDNIVNSVSAKFVFPNTGVLPGDHFSVVQPTSHDHRTYVALKNNLLTMLEDREMGDRPPPPNHGADSSPGSLVDTLLDIPGMNDPGFRQQMYQGVPSAVVHQLRLDGPVRVELVGMVDTFGQYGHLRPWEALLSRLRELVPEHRAVHRLAVQLAELGLVGGG
jgi:hypothetical protein